MNPSWVTASRQNATAWRASPKQALAPADSCRGAAQPGRQTEIAPSKAFSPTERARSWMNSVSPSKRLAARCDGPASGLSVQTLVDSRRQSGLEPSHGGGVLDVDMDVDMALVTFTTHISVASLATARLNAHQRSPLPEGGNWCVQALAPSPTSCRSPGTIRAGGASVSGSGTLPRSGSAS